MLKIAYAPWLHGEMVKSRCYKFLAPMKQPLFSIIFHPRIFSHFLCHLRSSSWSWLEPCIGELGRTLQDRFFFFFCRWICSWLWMGILFTMIGTRFMISLGISQWFQPGFNQLFNESDGFHESLVDELGDCTSLTTMFFSMGNFPIERWEKWESQSFPEWESWEYNG